MTRTYPPPLFFSNFLFTNLFSIKFLYFFIISSLFPYFDLFVSIFIQSYVNNNLHVSALYRYKSNILGTYSEHIFDSTQAPVCKCNRFPSRRRRRAALSIWHQLTQSIQRGESSFQKKCMDFHEIHPRVAYDLAHVCISCSVHTNKWRTTHNALCGYYKFSFRIFIWVYLNFSGYKQ